MKPRHQLAAAACLLLAALSVRADDWPKLRARGGEVYFADLDARAAFAKDNAKDLPETKRKLPAATAPAFDWSTQVSRTFVYTQKNNPQCWAFAAVTAFEWNWAIRNGGPVPILSVQPIIDQSHEEDGAPFVTALKVLLASGTCPLTAYPYTGKAAKQKPNVPLQYRAIAWGDVDADAGLPTVAALKKALLDHGPVVVGVYVTPLLEEYKGGVFREHFKVQEGGKQTNHSVVILGWDDRRGKGCWKVQNSWGNRWGELGYMWIEYGSNNIGHHACWVRPQSSQYQLPEAMNKQITGEIAPFVNWPKSKVVTLPAKPDLPVITPADAVKKTGERVVVEFMVKGLGTVQPSGHISLRSEAKPTEDGIVARLLGSELDKFPIKEPRELLDSYRRKTIRVRGSVIQLKYKDGTKEFAIEVGDPSQIEIVK